MEGFSFQRKKFKTKSRHQISMRLERVVYNVKMYINIKKFKPSHVQFFS